MNQSGFKLCFLSSARFLEGTNEQIALHVFRKEDSDNYELVHLYQEQIMLD